MSQKQVKQIWASLFSVMVLLAFSPLAFAQGAPAVPAPPPAQTAPSAMSDPPAPEAGGGSKIEKKDKKAGRATAKSSNSNKGGEVRGLDRADQRAGENGQQGRDTARTKQGR